MRATKLFIVLLLCCAACRNKEEPTKPPDISFDKIKWNEKNKDGDYAYRKQMVKDVLKSYQWTGIKKDSVIQMLGQPDDASDGNLSYYYQTEPFLGGFGTAIESIVFELTPDSTVKVARFTEDGWD